MIWNKLEVTIVLIIAVLVTLGGANFYFMNDNKAPTIAAPYHPH